jgi:hypothetical protein
MAADSRAGDRMEADSRAAGRPGAAPDPRLAECSSGFRQGPVVAVAERVPEPSSDAARGYAPPDAPCGGHIACAA